MELYFKDLESNPPDDAAMAGAEGHMNDLHEDTAEDIAFAEVSDRVYAAGLVY